MGKTFSNSLVHLTNPPVAMTIVGARSPEELFILWVYTISGPPVVGFMVPFCERVLPGHWLLLDLFFSVNGFIQKEVFWKHHMRRPESRTCNHFCTFVYSALNLYNLPNLDASIEYNDALDKKTYDIGGLNKNHVLALFINCFKHVRTHVLNHTHALFILLPGPFKVSHETTIPGAGSTRRRSRITGIRRSSNWAW